MGHTALGIHCRSRFAGAFFVSGRRSPSATPSTPEEPTQRLGTLSRLASIISVLVLLATKPIKVGIKVWLRIFDGVPTTS